MRQLVSHPRQLEHACDSRRLVAALRAIGVACLLACLGGCGAFGSSQQLKQLQMENDRLLSEYRAQRERVATLQETNAALEARVGEAERLLAQAGKTLPSSRISRVPQHSSSGPTATGNSPTGAVSQTPPKYVPPSVPSLPENRADGATADGAQWRPMRRQ